MKNKNHSKKSIAKGISNVVSKVVTINFKLASRFEQTLTDVLGVEYNVVDKPFDMSCNNNLKSTQTIKDKTI